MFCPKCGEEYRGGFYFCADCQVPLVSVEEFRRLEEKRRAEEEERRNIETVEVFQVQGEVEADIVKSLLSAHKIESFSTGQSVQSVLPFTVDGLGKLKILVRKEDAVKARKIIEEYLNNQKDDDKQIP